MSLLQSSFSYVRFIIHDKEVGRKERVNTFYTWFVSFSGKRGLNGVFVNLKFEISVGMRTRLAWCRNPKSCHYHERLVRRAFHPSQGFSLQRNEWICLVTRIQLCIGFDVCTPLSLSLFLCLSEYNPIVRFEMSFLSHYTLWCNAPSFPMPSAWRLKTFYSFCSYSPSVEHGAATTPAIGNGQTL